MSWQTLTRRLAQEVIELLDYESRCNLRLCSKADKETVDSTKPSARNLRITEFLSAVAPGKTSIRLDIDTFTIWFTGRENVTRIDRGWNEYVDEELSETKQKNRHELVGEFVGRLSQKGFMKADTVEIDTINFPVLETWNIKCNNLKIDRIFHEHYPGWLRKFIELGTKYKTFESNSWADDEEISTLLASIKVSESMKIEYDQDFTDEQLDEIEAIDLKIRSPNFTPEGVQRRLMKFLKYGKKDDELELYAPIDEDTELREEFIPKNLVVKTIRVDEEFNEFVLHLVGGFENVHGVHGPREIHCVQLGDMVRIECKVFKKPQRPPCIMYPL